MNLNCIELFAGCGGAAQGLEAAGFHHRALVEWDPDACATMRAAGLGPVVEGDVRDLDAVAAVAGESCDALWSSFPCQAFSRAGKRLGARDERNGWPWTVAAIDRFRPRWVLAENVLGLTEHQAGCVSGGGVQDLFGATPERDCSGCYLERVILPQLAERYPCSGAWVLDAADYGVPQHRRRVILWAGPVEPTRPAPTHCDPRRAEQLGLWPWVSMGEALNLGAFTLDHGRNTAAKPTREPVVPSTVPAPTIGGKGNQMVRGVRIVGGGSNPRERCHRPAPTVTAQEVKGTRAHGCPPAFNGGPDRASDALWLATGRRRLTVEECARLQGFPDEYPLQGTKASQYRQVGNAVPPTLARVVGLAVVDAEARR